MAYKLEQIILIPNNPKLKLRKRKMTADVPEGVVNVLEMIVRCFDC